MGFCMVHAANKTLSRLGLKFMKIGLKRCVLDVFLGNSRLRLVNIMTVQTFRDHQDDILGGSCRGGAFLSFFLVNT